MSDAQKVVHVLQVSDDTFQVRWKTWTLFCVSKSKIIEICWYIPK